MFLATVLADWCIFFLHFLSLFFFFVLFVWLMELVGCLLFFIRSIISFMAFIVLLIKVSIRWKWVSVDVAMTFSMAPACSWTIIFTFKCFAISLFCLFSFMYSAELLCNVLTCLVHCWLLIPFLARDIKFCRPL